MQAAISSSRQRIRLIDCGQQSEAGRIAIRRKPDNIPTNADRTSRRRGHEVRWLTCRQALHVAVLRMLSPAGERRWAFDHMLIWNAIDLSRKLDEFRNYYDENRLHQSLSGRPPGERSGPPPPAHAVLDHYAWRHHCRGLFQMPIAA